MSDNLSAEGWSSTRRWKADKGRRSTFGQYLFQLRLLRVRACTIAIVIREVVNRSKARMNSCMMRSSDWNDVGIAACVCLSVPTDREVNLAINHNAPLIAMGVLRNDHLDIGFHKQYLPRVTLEKPAT